MASRKCRLRPLSRTSDGQFLQSRFLASSSTPSIHLDFGRPLLRWPPGFARNISLGNSRVNTTQALYIDKTIDNRLHCTDSLSSYVTLRSGCFQFIAQTPRTDTCGSTCVRNCNLVYWFHIALVKLGRKGGTWYWGRTRGSYKSTKQKISFRI